MVGFGKRGLLERGSFLKNPFREFLAHLKILEILENFQIVENKGESGHLLEILENQEIIEILDIPPVKRPRHSSSEKTQTFLQ